MAESNNDRRYEVDKTETDTNILIVGGPMVVTTYTIRDTETGKVYESTNYDADAARSSAWEQADSDRS